MLGIARVQNKDIEFITASYTAKQNQIGAFTVELPLSKIDRFSIQFEPISLYWNDNLVVSGYVTEQPQLNLTKGDSRLTATLTCEDELTSLSCSRPKTDAHYQDLPTSPQLLTAIISDLLAYAAISGNAWALGDTSTMIDPLVETTLDLRSKTTLFAQIVEAVKSIPQLHLRYGGFSGGFHRLDIGAFGALTHFAYQHDNLEVLKLNRANNRVVRVVEPISGRSADSPVSLAEMSDIPNPLFPVSESPPASGKWIVTNASLSVGCQTAETFNVNKTRNDEVADSDPPQRAETANAIYLRAVRYLQKNQPFQAFTSTVYLRTPPRIGDSIHIRAQVQESVYDQITEQNILAETFAVAETLLMTQIKFDFDTGSIWDEFLEVGHNVDSYSLELTDSAYAEINDPALELYERLEQFSDHDIITSPVDNRGKVIDVLTFTTPPIGSIADCPIGLPTGKEFAFPLPAIPTGSTSVFARVLAITPGHAYIITQNPQISPPLGFTLCVDSTSPMWASFISENVTVQIEYEFL